MGWFAQVCERKRWRLKTEVPRTWMSDPIGRLAGSVTVMGAWGSAQRFHHTRLFRAIRRLNLKNGRIGKQGIPPVQRIARRAKQGHTVSDFCRSMLNMCGAVRVRVPDDSYETA